MIRSDDTSARLTLRDDIPRLFAKADRRLGQDEKALLLEGTGPLWA
jgi:hypothetical protein